LHGAEIDDRPDACADASPRIDMAIRPSIGAMDRAVGRLAGSREATRMMMTAPPTRMRTIRPLTTRIFNPIARRFAGWLPGFGILQYRGRKSGRTYRTPINAFRRDDSFVFALTYGADVQWVKNVVAAGGCTLRTRGRDVLLVEPELFVDPGRRLMPRVVRFVLRLVRATEFLRMRIATPP
jgi:deazaflavin-dependent oxidoreductase (nitroreductase family)